MKDIEKEKRAERRERYVFIAQEIRAIKNQQWVITSNFIFIYAGIIGFTKLFANGEITDSGGVMLLTLAFIVFCYGSYVLIMNQRGLIENRRISIQIENTFFTLREIRKDRVPEIYFTFRYTWWIWVLFIVSLLIGFILVFIYFNHVFCIKNGFNDLLRGHFSFFI